MSKFIYVFSSDIKERLISEGFILIQEDKTKDIYIFENREKTSLSFDNIECVFSNILTL